MQVVYAVISGGLLILFARPVTALFMNQPDIVNAGSYMLIAMMKAAQALPTDWKTVV